MTAESKNSQAAPVDLENEFAYVNWLARHHGGVVRVEEGGRLVMVVAKPIHEVDLIAKVSF